MKEREEDNLPQEKDRHLDIPSEANTEKHLNFLDIEDNSDQKGENKRKDDETVQRQKQWKEGLEEGRKLRNGE